MAYKNKSNAVKNLIGAMNKTGTLAHQAAAISHICTTGDKAGIGIAFGMLPDPDLTKEVGGMIVENAKEILQDPSCASQQTNDAQSFRRTGYFLKGPTAPPDDASKPIKDMYGDAIDKYVEKFEMTRSQKVCLLAAGIKCRDYLLKTDLDKLKELMQIFKCHWDQKLLCDELFEDFHIWLFTKSGCLIPSPNKKDVKTYIDFVTKKRVKMRVHFYPVAKRVIWNKACLPESEGGFPGFF
jgi:hypothetical protein